MSRHQEYNYVLIRQSLPFDSQSINVRGVSVRVTRHLSEEYSVALNMSIGGLKKNSINL